MEREPVEAILAVECEVEACAGKVGEACYEPKYLAPELRMFHASRIRAALSARPAEAAEYEVSWDGMQWTDWTRPWTPKPRDCRYIRKKGG